MTERNHGAPAFGPIEVPPGFFQELADAVFPSPPPGHRGVLDHLREVFGEEATRRVAG